MGDEIKNRLSAEDVGLIEVVAKTVLEDFNKTQIQAYSPTYTDEQRKANAINSIMRAYDAVSANYEPHEILGRVRASLSEFLKELI